MTEIMQIKNKAGILIANLGTPDAPERKPVARFLREFLSDPRVVDLPRFLWLPLLNLVIIPVRAGQSAKAYKSGVKVNGPCSRLVWPVVVVVVEFHVNRGMTSHA